MMRGVMFYALGPVGSVVRVNFVMKALEDRHC